MASGLLEVMKMAAKEVNENGQPTDLRVGTVTSAKPLKVQVSSQFILPESLLIVPQHLTNYKVSVTVDWNTENKSGGSSYSEFESHNHGITGTKEITINNSLKVGDKVGLLRKQGGQSYFILDRI